MKYLINISYDGSKFYGFQKQKNKDTIQGNIESILSKILNEDIKTVGASRTDRGVHAYSQYISFDTNKEIDINKFKYSLNSLINDSIYIKSIKKVKKDFNPRYSVKMKEYIYKINVGEYNPIEKDYVYQYNKKIDIDLMNKVSNKLIGTHDFRSFTSDKDKGNYIRDIDSIKIIKKSNYIFIHIKAKSFLRYMIRNMVGLMIEINEGTKNISDIDKIFESKDRSSCGVCAPSCGLYLYKIEY